MLVVERDPGLARLMSATLSPSGYVITRCRTIDEAETLCGARSETCCYRVIVLDTEGCDTAALEFVRRLRRRGASSSILLLWARTSLENRIKGLEAGADDYLAKPFEIDELRARVRALSRRQMNLAPQPVLQHGDLMLDRARQRVMRCGRVVPLSRREYALLELLVTSRGAIVGRAEIEERLYSWCEDLRSNAVEVHVHHLRRKLGRTLIMTVRGIGYMVE